MGTPPAGLLQTACDPRIAWSAFKIALVVGTVLNTVNNGDRLLRGDAVNWWQFALNFLVPFCVSSYGAAGNDSRRVGGD
jgi:hypothetical protein